GLARLLMLETDGRPRLFAAAVLMLLGHWVNVGIGIMLVPLVLLGGGRSRWRAALLIGASTLSVSLFARALPLPRTTTAVISISAWPHAWSLLLQNAAVATVPARRAAAGMAILIAVAIALASGRSRRLLEAVRPAA